MVKNKDSKMAMGHREWLRELAECDKVISDEEVEAFGRIPGEGRVKSEDEVDEDLEDERQRLNSILGLPADTYSLTKIKVILPESTNYGIKSGITHMRMNIFSPFSRGLQGGAIAITAFATAGLLKPRLWTESVIDQIVDDGDTYYCDSYKGIKIPDRKTLTVLELKKSLCLQHTHTAAISIDDAVQTGTFRSKKPTEMHLIKALQLFFKNYDACVLTSPVLSISIWRDGRNYNVFDGQPRNKNLLPDDSHGSAKLITLQDLIGVLFVILEKSNVNNEHFVLYPITLKGVTRISNDPEEGIKSLGPPQRRPSGYNIQGKFRAVVSSSFHIDHPNIPQALRRRAHLIVAIAALVYSRLINAPKWTTPMLDLIINQAHIYFIDLVRVLDKKFDDNFSLNISDILGDIFLGIYGARVKVWENVIPGQGKKGKITIDSGLREFFKDNELGILEAKRMYYAVWKDNGKYYFLDPFACDWEGFRVDSSDPGELQRYQKATACVIMNSSINELMEIILENTGNTEKDPFFIHGLQVLYVKTHSTFDGPGGTIVYRSKGTNRRPQPTTSPIRELSDRCVNKLDKIPVAKTDDETMRESECQFPEPMMNIQDFMMKEEEFIAAQNEDENVKDVRSYKVVNHHRIILHASKNCLSEEFEEASRGRQCLSIALAVLSFAKVKHPSKWRSNDLDYLIDVGDKAHADLISWIAKGSPQLQGDSGDGDVEEEEEENEGNKEEENEEGEERNIERGLNRAPSHIDISMLPSRMKFGINDVKFGRRMSMAQGDADPLVNLGEAFDHYFKKYDEMILENKGLMYPIWKSNGNYFTFNPYGGDEEGWRLRDQPGAFVVTDSINELIDMLHGILEFNDRKFFIHFVHIESVGPGNKYKSPVTIEEPQDDIETYQTAFLPLTDADVLALKPEPKEVSADEDEEEVDEEAMEEDEGADDEEVKKEEKDEEEGEEEKVVEEEKPLEDPLREIEEEDRADPPKQLNLFLLTTNVKLEDELVDQNAQEALEYERLKYNHPPPYVVPPKRVLAMLLAAKKATKSVPSLVSCFSVDSKLGIKTDLPPVEAANGPVIEAMPSEHNSKLIKLPPRKYLFSRISPIGFTPLRAINEKFIHDNKENEDREKKCRNEKLKVTCSERFYFDELPDEPGAVRIMPSIIPLGPVIQTPVPRERIKPCAEGKKRVCQLSERERENLKLEKIVCKTEDILFDMIFPMLKFDEKSEEESEKDENIIDIEEKLSQVSTKMQEEEEFSKKINFQQIESMPEKIGFTSIGESFGIISANDCLKDRESRQDYHLKACYFAAMLCILAKIKMSVEKFHETLLDQIIFLSEKIYSRTGSLRYKLSRLFRNIEFLDIKFNVILKQTAYADPENFESDVLPKTLDTYFKNHSTGILVFGNAAYAFWLANGKYYVFDPYACDKKGQSSEVGTAALLEFYTIEGMLKKIQENLGISVNQPYRIHTLCITHMEEIKLKKDQNKPRKPCAKETLEESPLEIDEEELSPSIKSDVSLIELSDWVKYNNYRIPEFDVKLTTFTAINNFNASALEVPVVENDITRPLLAPFKTRKSVGGYSRRKPFDRKFNEHSILLEPIDLCIMAWARIRDPTEWGTRTIRGIYEASQDLVFDSLLAAEDSTVSGMIDGLLPEFDVANYRFHAVFAPIHIGTLYAVEGWNLAMSLNKVFETEIYSGAIILCGKSHIGVMKRGERFYAWWGVTGKKNMRIITSDLMEDFLRLVVMEIGETEETEFQMRVITISYAKKLDPDCDDLRGLHEPALTSSLPQVYRRDGEPYDIDEIFKPSLPTSSNPVFILGTVALDQRDLLKEPSVKRCYFVALIALMVKRDIIQSPMSSMIDKLVQVADNLYREFDNTKYHTEHILRNVTIMNRIFDFRDVASELFIITENYVTGQNNFYALLKSKLKKHFKQHNDGILHFTNCCYGFWYSRGTDSYYYLDPYPCNSKGRRVSSINGSACLCVFSSICQMVKQMCANKFENTTGFFIHRLHIESINAAPFLEFQEDPMWVYLDYHWSYHHVSKSPSIPKKKSKKKKQVKEDICRDQLPGVPERTFWNNYVIEVPQLIYSVWGTLGAYDTRFGERVGKNQAAICVAVLAMQNLCHPSKWSSGILDSAVICGDTYYTESIRNAVRKGSKYSNIFNLQPCFKVFPHIWKIEYLADMCGVLYGGQGKLPLSKVLKSGLKYSKNILLKCGKITLGILSADNGFYVADPCWTGPPLFFRNHGAVYVLRCKNFTTMIYAIIKMINSNQRLEFSLTPVVFEFKQEVCRSSDTKKHIVRNKISMDRDGGKPGLAQGPRVPVCGAMTTGDEADYDRYRRNVEFGLKYGEKLENPVVPSPMPRLDRDNARKISISTKWRKYRGVPQPRIRYSPSVDPKIARKFNPSSSSEESVTNILEACDRYPLTIDFVADKDFESSMKRLTRKKVKPETPLSKPLDCLPRREFIMKKSKKEFKKRTKEMADEFFKIYKHRLREESPEVGENEIEEIDEVEATEEEDYEENIGNDVGETDETENEG